MTTRIRRVERITGITDASITDMSIREAANARGAPWLRRRRPRPGR
jgi:hypothetical protein